MAAKSANPDELIPAEDMWLHKLTQSNDKVLREAITYKTSFEAVTEPDNIYSSSKVSQHSEKNEKPQSHLHSLKIPLYVVTPKQLKSAIGFSEIYSLYRRSDENTF